MARGLARKRRSVRLFPRRARTEQMDQHQRALAFGKIAAELLAILLIVSGQIVGNCRAEGRIAIRSGSEVGWSIAS
jgi:hypothetical protein